MGELPGGNEPNICQTCRTTCSIAMTRCSLYGGPQRGIVQNHVLISLSIRDGALRPHKPLRSFSNLFLSCFSSFLPLIPSGRFFRNFFHSFFSHLFLLD